MSPSRSRLWKPLFRISAVLLALVMLAGCSSQPAQKQEPASQPAPAPQPQPQPAQPKEAVLNLAGSSANKNYCGLTSTTVPGTDRLMAGRLVTVTADSSQWVPDLAERWEANGSIWTFHLRRDVKWHDGKPFTAKDVVFTFGLYANPKTGSVYGAHLATVKGIEAFKEGEAETLAGLRAKDDYTVEIELGAPSGSFLSSQLLLTIFPEHILESVKPEEICQAEYWTKNRIGTGPYVWKQYLEDQRIEFEANPDYYRGKPQIEKVIMHLFANAETQLAAYEKGSIDGTEVPVTNLEYARMLENTTITTFRTLTVRSIAANVSYSEFADRRVRQAIAHAIDRDTLIKGLFKDTVRPAYTLYPQEWAVPSDLDKYPYNPDRARELLREAGWKGDQEYELVYYYRDQDTANLMVAVQQMLGAVGIKVKPVLLDAAALREQINSNKLVIFYGALGVPADPESASFTLQCGYEPPKGNNTTRYCNEQIDELLAKGRSELDQAKRAEIYQQVSRLLNEDLHWVYLWEPLALVATNARVQGLETVFGPGFLPFYAPFEKLTLR